MKNLILWATCFLLQNNLVLANNNPTTKNIALDQAYIPEGFDDNDRGQFAVIGGFANTCYKIGPYALKIDQVSKKIIVQQQAYFYKGGCIQIPIPFSQIINVGILSAGKYSIMDYYSGKNLGELSVATSKNVGPDDFLYAPVTDAYVESENQRNRLVLTGVFSDRCSEIESIDVLYQKNVLVVQPVIRRIQQASCSLEKTRFMKFVELSPDVHGVHLLHVRSLEGQAINKIVDLE